MTEPKIDGIKVKMGGEEWVVPPLSFRQLKRLMRRIEAMQAETDPVKNMEATVEIAHAALSRNYPDLPLEAVEDMVDLSNVRQVTEAVMGASGFFAQVAGKPPMSP